MKDLNVQALAYDPVIPPVGHPQANTYDADGTILRLSYPHAKSVSLVTGEKEYPFTKEEGFWELRFPARSGINYVQILVDGDEVLSPYLPIGYGYSRPYNCGCVCSGYQTLHRKIYSIGGKSCQSD